MTPKPLINQILNLPKKPGVYLFRDAGEKLLYVGKAKNLRNRVSSYFQISFKQPCNHVTIKPSPSLDLTPAKQLMVARVASLEITVVSNETEALLYEAELIKRHRPPFNVVLADDKSFVYIKFDFDSIWPDVYPLRRPRPNRQSKSLLFGPYPSAGAAYTVLRLAKRIFPYCQKLPRHLHPPHPRGCLNWCLGRCPGPCMGKITPAQYAANLKQMIPLFQGRLQGLLKVLHREMRMASRSREFETAAIRRDQIEALNMITTRQNIVGLRKESYDVVSLARDEHVAVANLFRVREGALVDRVAFPLQQTERARHDELLQSFAELYYATTSDIPRLLFVPSPITSPLPTLSVRVPRRGKKYQLLGMGEANARSELERYSTWKSSQTSATHAGLTSLMQLLMLPQLPERIETYDISNIQGLFAYGAMTVAVNGIPAPTEYRSFRIRTVRGSNDVAMLAEMLRRRFAHSISNVRVNGRSPLPPDNYKLTTNHWPLPDLIILDGGKPQLGAATEVLKEFNIDIPVIAIAKGRGIERQRRRARGEEVWIMRADNTTSNVGVAKRRASSGRPGTITDRPRRAHIVRPYIAGEYYSPLQPEKLTTDELTTKNVLQLLDRLRDEAHRFGIKHYRGRHRKELIKSARG